MKLHQDAIQNICPVPGCGSQSTFQTVFYKCEAGHESKECETKETLTYENICEQVLAKCRFLLDLNSCEGSKGSTLRAGMKSTTSSSNEEEKLEIMVRKKSALSIDSPKRMSSPSNKKGSSAGNKESPTKGSASLDQYALNSLISQSLTPLSRKQSFISFRMKI
jgi:hypothetical protein